MKIMSNGRRYRQLNKEGKSRSIRHRFPRNNQSYQWNKQRKKKNNRNNRNSLWREKHEEWIDSFTIISL